jgi:PAS domain S-box-containing protein
LPELLFETDAKGTLTFVSAAMHTRYGWTIKDIEGKMNLFDFVAPFDRERAKETTIKVIKGEHKGWTEYNLFYVDGSTAPFDVSTTPIFRDGVYEGLRGIAIDITERKRVEEALRKQAAMLDAAHDAIMTLDPEGIITYWNRGAERLYGWTKEEAEGHDANTLLKTKFPESKEVLWPKLIESGLWEGELRNVTRDGVPVTVTSSWTLLKDEEGNASIILEISSDITERKQMEEQLESTFADLQRSNAELEQFAYIASHDLQEPLRMITSYMQIIEEDYKGKLDEDADEYIGFAVDGAKRMQTLINDLLKYSRVGTKGKPLVPMSAETALTVALDNMQVTIDETKAVITHDQLPIVLGDDGQLSQVFQNLLSNAIKFRSNSAPQIHISVEQTPEEWVFSVQDNGIGIDMKYADRIFTIFQRLHGREEYPGTGIGLAVVKKIVQRHGGRIWVKSAPESGSTFYFTLPTTGAVRAL